MCLRQFANMADGAEASAVIDDRPPATERAEVSIAVDLHSLDDKGRQ